MQLLKQQTFKCLQFCEVKGCYRRCYTILGVTAATMFEM